MAGRGGAAYDRRVADRSATTLPGALASPRYLVSGWPWRALGYLVSAPLLLTAALPVLLPVTAGTAVAWAVLARWLSGPWLSVLVALAGAALVAAVAPVAVAPVTSVERLRLGLVDRRPLPPRPAPSGADGWGQLRARYTQPWSWREVAHAVVAVPAAAAVFTALVPVLAVVGVVAAAPLVVLLSDEPVTFGPAVLSRAGEAVPLTLAALAALPVLGYLVGLAAAGLAAAGRALLWGSSAQRLRAELSEVEQSRARIARAFEAERRRIERDLHDGAQQRLVGLTLRLGMARLDLPPDSPASEAVAAAHEEAKQLLAEFREFVHGIHPAILTDRGLVPALRELAGRCPVPVTVDADLPGRPPGPIESTAYFVVAEALSNVAKHSGARRAEVTVRGDGAVLSVRVRDDGCGGADAAAGTGLVGLSDRVAAVGGTLDLSSPVGGPTVVRVELPWGPSQR
ncbi:hypothetical protein AC529_09330 [Thermobifida cellulosilytica TB100]|uniref:histidine kinase n=1 Tax=Thermobifida cellulosilytica TB100 TaxID=665004 RepID=A0A147KI60_THECS|nr:hypothetical protein AC529_09330 [Thermobifida cellulosilytica TB100]